MPYRIVTLPDKAIIVLAFNGWITIAERIQALRALVHEHERTGYVRLLADFRQAHVVAESADETDAHAERLAQEPSLHRLRVAIVGETARVRPIEYLAALRGYFFERFGSMEDAMQWLASQQGSGE